MEPQRASQAVDLSPPARLEAAFMFLCAGFSTCQRWMPTATPTAELGLVDMPWSPDTQPRQCHRNQPSELKTASLDTFVLHAWLHVDGATVSFNRLAGPVPPCGAVENCDDDWSPPMAAPFHHQDTVQRELDIWR